MTVVARAATTAGEGGQRAVIERHATVGLAIAQRDLHEQLTYELDQLERDAHAARRRNLPHLAADLSRLRTRVQKVLRELDKAEDAAMRRDDYEPRGG